MNQFKESCAQNIAEWWLFPNHENSMRFGTKWSVSVRVWSTGFNYREFSEETRYKLWVELREPIRDRKCPRAYSSRKLLAHLVWRGTGRNANSRSWKKHEEAIKQHFEICSAATAGHHQGLKDFWETSTWLFSLPALCSSDLPLVPPLDELNPKSKESRAHWWNP